jgi:hypothetical protein
MSRDEILKANPIVDFVRERGHELKRAGGNFVTSGCPVARHKHGHRPVMLYPATQSWSCHDCKIGGTVIDWVMHEENATAADAMRILGGRKNRSEPVAVYDYTDENGNLLYQVCRFAPKRFRRRQPNGAGGYIWNTKNLRRVVYRLPQVIAAQTVHVVEGEKDADGLFELGFTTTTNCGGAGKWCDDFSETLRGKNIIVFGDNDEPGRAHVAQVVESLTGVAGSIKQVTLPNGFRDVSEFIVAQPANTAKQAIGKLIEDTAVTPPTAPKSPRLDKARTICARLNRNLPKVQLPGDGRLLSAFATDSGGILKDCGIYQRGGLAFIVNQQRDGLEVITPSMLRTLAEQYLVCFRVRREVGNVVSVPRTMSTEDAQGVLSAKQFLSRLPKVARIATASLPVMRSNGAIELLPNGYDSDSLTLTLSQCDYDKELSMTAAIEAIDGLLSEFPFADDGSRSKAVAVAAMVGLFSAGLFGTGILRPVFIYLANAEGAGKTLLAKCAISPVHGLVKIDGDLKDKTETSKELLAAVLETRPYILFDNCKRHLDSPYLEAFVSAAVWSGRILGVSKMFAGENLVTVFVTGNGCTVSPDMRRRSLFVELFMEDERAEDRKFQRVLDDAALLAMRAQILAALWALVREWDSAGRPKPTKLHAGFPRWAEIIGGVVEHAGYGCPLAAAEIPSAADVDGADMRELVKRLAGSEPTKFDEVVDFSREHGLFERLIGDGGELKPPEKSAFGKLLKRYDRRVFAGGRHFVVDGKGRYKTFRVETASTGSTGHTGISAKAEETAFL